MATFNAVYNKGSKFFHKDDPRRNRILLEQKQAYANDQLRVQYHLFLNEVLDLLDLPRILEGQFAGWVWRKYQPDTLVDFGVEKVTMDEVPLVFNCQENILYDVFGRKS